MKTSRIWLRATLALYAMAVVAMAVVVHPAVTQAAEPKEHAGPPHALAGLWTASGYACTDGSAPTQEQVRISGSATLLLAVKVTGDHCIPAGEVTWRGVPADPSFPVQVHVGGPVGLRTYAAAKIVVDNQDRFRVLGPGWTWTYTRLAFPSR